MKIPLAEQIEEAEKMKPHVCKVEGCERTDVVQKLGICGLHRERLKTHGDVQADKPPRKRHGHAIHGRETPEYKTWHSMKQRCYQPNTRVYPLYGGKGITICDRWLQGEGELSAFECFLADMGPRPGAGYSIDRIDSTGNYSPENCRWATIKEQNRNRSINVRVDVDGRSVSLIEACEIKNISYGMVRNRINKLGWDADRALNTPNTQPRAKR